jgi:hypothetical protein
MEELIEILINLIANFFQNKAVKPVPPKLPGAKAVPVVRAEPPSRATMTKKMPTARRAVRRPMPPNIAIARPIVTNVVTSTPPVVMAVTRPIQAKSTEVAHVAPTQSAIAIRKWMVPATMRNQFLLTEILQPPLALRDKQNQSW